MKQFQYTVTDRLGIHARPAGMLAKIAQRYAGTEIAVTCNGQTARATQLMKMMSLGIRQGSVVTVTAQGPDEDAAIAAMDDFFSSNL
ncbi:MAG: HPr family phosphocarrier protein [Clostridia bacterium]|nr:HPr family phosphocarrier protein [Clostridia bacterium]